MKLKHLTLLVAVVFMVGLPLSSSASSHKGHGDSGGSHSNMDQSGHGQAMKSEGRGGHDHSRHEGELIHESVVDGHSFAWHLIDMREKMKGMKGMEHMKATHHLMVYIKSPDGKAVEKAKVGYMVKNSEGKREKAMCMGMGGGFGADVTMGKPGNYTVYSKVVFNGKTLKDKFSYTMK